MRIEDSPAYDLFDHTILVAVYEGADIIWDNSGVTLFEILAYFPDKGFSFRSFACQSLDSVELYAKITDRMSFVPTKDEMLFHLIWCLDRPSITIVSNSLINWCARREAILPEENYEE